MIQNAMQQTSKRSNEVKILMKMQAVSRVSTIHVAPLNNSFRVGCV